MLLGSTATEPVQTNTAYGFIALIASALASVFNRISTPRSFSCFSAYLIKLPIFPRCGGNDDKYICPPSRSSFSISVTSNLRCARINAASSPAGPPPITTAFRPFPSSVGALYTVSSPRYGFTEHCACPSPVHNALPAVSKQYIHPRHFRISSARPERAFSPHSGSASHERPIATKSIAPLPSVSSQNSGSRNTEVAATGIVRFFLISAASPNFHPC